MEANEFKNKLVELRSLLARTNGRHIDWVGEIEERRCCFRYISGCLPVMCYAEINPVSNLFLVRGMLELPVKEERRPAVTEYIMQVNYQLPIGCYTMDAADGEVRFKMGFCFGHEPLSAHLMVTHIDATCYFLDEYIEHIVHIMMAES